MSSRQDPDQSPQPKASQHIVGLALAGAAMCCGLPVLLAAGSAVTFLGLGLGSFVLVTIGVGAAAVGWLRWRSGSIWPAVIMHAGINALAGLWLLVLSAPGSTLIGSPVGLLGIMPFAVFASWLIASGRLRSDE